MQINKSKFKKCVFWQSTKKMNAVGEYHTGFTVS